MASNYPKLSEGAINKILANEKVLKPILQIVVYKQMTSANTQTKYRFQMTDGIENSSSFVIVLPELIQRIALGEFEKFTVIRLDSYTLNSQPQMDRQIIIISDMSVVMTGSKIGKRLDKTEGNVGLLTNVSLNSNSSMNRSYNSPNTSSLASTSHTADRQNVCPITAITPYFNAWHIRARVTSKSNKRNWSNAKGEGSVFSFDVMDQSGEIRINAFTKECEKYYDLIQNNKVFYISRGSVKTANKRFSNLANDYEITLNADSLVEECDDKCLEVPKMRYKFIQIKDLDAIALQSIVDVIAVVKAIDDVACITSKKTNKELKKRDITLLDNTSYEVRFTLWNEMAEQFDCELNSVVAVKNALVGEFNGKTLSAVSSTTIQVEPDIPETNLLKDWFEREGQTITTNPLSKSSEGKRDNEWRYLCQINEQTVNNENRSYFNVIGRVVQTNRSPLYKACGQNGCLKKVQDNNNGFYHCDRCQTDSPQFQWRLILSVALCDCTGESWVTLFQEQAEKILGMSAQELSELQDNEPQLFMKALASIEFKAYEFRVGSKIEQYMDEVRVKSVAYGFSQIDSIKHSKQLIKQIKEWTQ